MRIQDFLRHVFDASNRSKNGSWVMFRDGNPDTLVAMRFDDENEGDDHPPTCILVTPDLIKVQKYYGAWNAAHFPRDKSWDAILCVKEYTRL